MKRLCYILLALLALAACAPSRPSGILSPDEMEDVLYDMHIAQTIYNNRRSVDDNADIIGLRASVLLKHGVTQAEWDSSYSYYCRNAREMYDIYQSLAARVERNLVALGGKVAGVQDDVADTANVWRDASSFILMQQPPYNRLSFEVMPDTTFKDGDRITLQYDVQFIFQDGYREVTSFVAVYYDNDSVATGVAHTTIDGHGVVTINNDVKRLHVNKIRGYIMLAQEMSQSTTDQNSSVLRLAAIRNVKLLHLPTLPPAKVAQPETETHADSVRRDSLWKDSVMKSHVTIMNAITTQ